MRILKHFLNLIKKDKCDVCNEKFRATNILYDENLRICQECAQHMNDISGG